jgi:hypothetical protein
MTVRTTLHQEALSDAALAAVVADAGLTMAKPQIDDDGVDWTIAAGLSPAGGIRSPKLDVQLKSTGVGTVPTGDGGTFAYDLEQKDYRRLILDDYQVPRVLVVMTQLPAGAQEAWTPVQHEGVTMRHCLYWMSLRGLPATTNDVSTRVHVPCAQRLDAAALEEIVDRIRQGGTP